MRTTIGIAIIVFVPMIPGLALAATEWRAATGTWALAAMTITLATMLTGVRLGIGVGIALAIASFFGYLAADNPWLALIVMGCSASLYGMSSRRGLNSAIVMAPISLSFIMAEQIPIIATADDARNALLTSLVVLLATLWSAPIGWFMSTRLPKRTMKELSPARARTFTIVMAVVAGIAMWFTVYFQWKHGGAWFLLTLFVVLQPNMRDTWTKSLERAVGTILGVAIAYGVSLVVRIEWMLYLAGFIFLGIAIAMFISPKRTYWQFATFLTPGIVLLEGTGSSIATTDLQRLQFTLLGVATSLCVVALLIPIYGREPRPESHPVAEDRSPTSQ